MLYLRVDDAGKAGTGSGCNTRGRGKQEFTCPSLSSKDGSPGHLSRLSQEVKRNVQQCYEWHKVIPGAEIQAHLSSWHSKMQWDTCWEEPALQKLPVWLRTVNAPDPQGQLCCSWSSLHATSAPKEPGLCEQNPWKRAFRYNTSSHGHP
ncbi:hypothetical protein AV530_001619 [Patagioenas fasciata monilis]|uniref:Uncharacterized protein n=1 Tax=Patagioenas fasciata monilis TaxID=372326 RepID=A0A1V4K4U1_PATFA|nr:hypothetical protein AV530_001619 [Patagioenas fasciata monilis]